MFNIWSTLIINILHAHNKSITHYDYFVKTKANPFMQTFDTDQTDKLEVLSTLLLRIFIKFVCSNILMFSYLYL